MALIEVLFPLDSVATRKEGMANLRRKQGEKGKIKRHHELLHTTDTAEDILHLLNFFIISNLLFTPGEEEAF